MNKTIQWAVMVLAAMSAAGARAETAPSFGIRVPAPAAPLFAAPPAPTRQPNVFVREAPGTSARFAAPALIYREPGAPLPPVPASQRAFGPAGAGQQMPMTVNGRPFGFIDPSMFPRATVTLQAPRGLMFDCRELAAAKGVSAP